MEALFVQMQQDQNQPSAPLKLNTLDLLHSFNMYRLQSQKNINVFINSIQESIFFKNGILHFKTSIITYTAVIGSSSPVQSILKQESVIRCDSEGELTAWKAEH